MYLPDAVFEVLKKIGMKDSDHVGEFWLANRQEFAREIHKIHPNSAQIFSNQLKWKTIIGADCQSAIRQFIEERMIQIKSAMEMSCRTGVFHEHILDFLNFSFISGGNTYTLADFQELEYSSKIYPIINLMGIDLSGISIHSCSIINVALSDACLDRAQIGSVKFMNCSLNAASLRFSRLGCIEFINSGINGADLTGAFLNAVKFDDRSVESGIVFKKVSYFYMIYALLFSFTHKIGFYEHGSPEKWGHTVFLYNNTIGMSGHRNYLIKNYIEWYENQFSRINSIRRLGVSEVLSFTLSLVFTKSWTSLSVLGLWALVINIVFSLIYVTNTGALNNFDGTFLSSLYFSVVTFATLGYGDITPKAGFGQVVVMIEVIIGYLTLGSYAFLIGHKVAARSL